MNRIEAMMSLWPLQDGFVTQVWRLTDRVAFSPSNRLQPTPLGAPGELGTVVLRSLELSRSLSAEPHSAEDADRDFTSTREVRASIPALEIMVDQEEGGLTLVWRQHYDEAGQPTREAIRVLERPDALTIEQAVVALLRGEGIPAGGPADIELLLRELELVSRGELTALDAAAAFRSAARRFGANSLGPQLSAAADELAAAASDADALRPLLSRLWDWLDTQAG